MSASDNLFADYQRKSTSLLFINNKIFNQALVFMLLISFMNFIQISKVVFELPLSQSLKI